jgi:hypothetical protein
MSDTDVADDAARDAELDRLRRIAFGRTSTDDEVLAAERAQLELARAEAAAAVAEPVEAPAPVAELVEAPVETYEEPRPRRPWLLPALAGLALGALVATGATLALRSTPEVPVESLPTATSTSTGMNYFLGDPPASSDEPGDVAAAREWFDRDQVDDDLVGVGELRPEFIRDSVRLVHSSPLARVWLVEQTDGKMCVETTETESQATIGSCVDSVEFAERGASVTSNVLTAEWNGSQVRVVLTQR